jgi:hypothetical protein
LWKRDFPLRQISLFQINITMLLTRAESQKPSYLLAIPPTSLLNFRVIYHITYSNILVSLAWICSQPLPYHLSFHVTPMDVEVRHLNPTRSVLNVIRNICDSRPSPCQFSKKKSNCKRPSTVHVIHGIPNRQHWHISNLKTQHPTMISESLIVLSQTCNKYIRHE